MQLKFKELDYQTKAVKSIVYIFDEVNFIKPSNFADNPYMDFKQNEELIKTNIREIRAKNKITEGENFFKENILTLDVLMETGTGKTFTYIDAIFNLNRNYGLSKFIALVPSNPIRVGTMKAFDITRKFFQGKYHKTIKAYEYSHNSLERFIHENTNNISVLIMTYQAFNKESNKINKKLETPLITQAKTYMQAIAKIKPVVIMDEPHRFEGKKTLQAIPNLNPQFIIRFGATYKSYKNLIYTLDSIDAFRNNLVKRIEVDCIGNEDIDKHSIILKETSGTTKTDRAAKLHYKNIAGLTESIKVSAGDNLGEKTKISAFDTYVVENINRNSLEFTNGFILDKGSISSYGSLLDDMRKILVSQTLDYHFEREEILFNKGIKSISLFFIDNVSKYRSNEKEKGIIAEEFEYIYKKKLKNVLSNGKISHNYRKYLERTECDISKIHNGYFSKDNSTKDKDISEAVDLILREKEKILSLDSDLRFIFSMWALREGWDNANVFNICKLAPTGSDITRLQQVGRGLRIAVDKNGDRLTLDNVSEAEFSYINMLNVIVPSSEKNFIEAIQSEILAHSTRKTVNIITDEALKKLDICKNARQANKLLDILAERGFIILNDETGEGKILKRINNFETDELEKVCLENNITVSLENLQKCFDDYFKFSNSVKNKQGTARLKVKINEKNFDRFRDLWENINRRAYYKFDIDEKEIKKQITHNINEHFHIYKPVITSQKSKLDSNIEVSYISAKIIQTPESDSLLTTGEIINQISKNTKLSRNTVIEIFKNIKKSKFEMLGYNPNLAVSRISEIANNCIYDKMIEKINYEVVEININNQLQENRRVKKHIETSQLGQYLYNFSDADEALHKKSLYEQTLAYDSDIELETIKESSIDSVVVFAKLPKIEIPTPVGKYNPDFAYVINKNNRKEIYLIIETKGYDAREKIATSERQKINAGRQFFDTLKSKGINIRYETKINKEKLTDILQEVITKP